jgi:putative iron-dependent peroxidase
MPANNFQAGILAPLPSQARYLTFALADAAQVRPALQALRGVADRNHVFGFAESLVECLDANVPGLKPFPSLAGAGIEIPATPGTLWCWLRGDDRGKLLLTSHTIRAKLAGAFELLQSIDAFKYDSGRDLTGYEDGTENPKDDDAIAAAIVSSRGPGLDGSSFVAVQQWQHNLARFAAMSSEDQDNSVGRRKVDNEELADAPESSHVKRTAQESFSPEAFLLRRSMPWNSEAQQGLVFVAFGNSFDAFEAQLKRMIGFEDGITDALFQFTRPLSGNYYWCPPLRDGLLDLSALGL